MDRISITVSGRLGSDPRRDTTEGGSTKVIMSLAAEPRNSRESPTRWFKVVAYGHVAAHAADSLHKGDYVTVRADDTYPWAWADDQSKEPRGTTVLIAYDIAASVRFDNVTSGAAARRAARDQDAADITAEEQANRSVLAGVSAETA